MFLAAVIPSVIGLAGGALASRDAKKATQAQIDAQKEMNKPDPRVDNMLWGGSNGNGPQQGLINRFQGLLDAPQSDAMKQFGEQSGQFLQNFGLSDMNTMRNGSLGLLGGMSAPAMGASMSNGVAPVNASGGQMLWNRGETVNAPSQNGIDLSGSYNSLVNGPAGANPYLTGAIQKGINQSSNAFGNMIHDAKSATQDVLGNIRGGAVIAGGYGGSRQGIAEGRAIDSMNTQLGRAASQFGQNNTDAAVAAQAGAYDTDRNRQLAATQGLGAQQYGVASQNSAQAQQANMQNQAIGTDMSKFGAAQTQNAAMANAQMGLQNNQFNAGLHHQANAANLQSQLGTNQLNTNRTQSGLAGLSGLLGTAYQQAGNQDNYNINRAQQINGLLSPYLNKTAVPQAAPAYSNSTSAGLGGALMGMQLGQGLMGMFSGGGGVGGFTGPSGSPFTGPSAGSGILSGFPGTGY